MRVLHENPIHPPDSREQAVLCFVALLIVLEIDLAAIFNTGTLNNSLSLMFFGWFTLVFIWLATRSLPNHGNLLTEFYTVLKDVLKKVVNMMKIGKS